MTDNEIIKYLEQAIDKYNKNEIFVDNIRLDKLSLDIIKRQQVEIERLKIENQSLRSAANSYKIHYCKAVKGFEEFAQRAYIDNPFACQYCVHSVEDGRSCVWKGEHEEDVESCLGKHFKYDSDKMVGVRNDRQRTAD